MVTPACYPSSDAGRRYSRGCPPYSLGYPDRRLQLSSHDTRSPIMTERDQDSESSQPRKRIAVAVGFSSKRAVLPYISSTTIIKKYANCRTTHTSAIVAANARSAAAAIRETVLRVRTAKMQATSHVSSYGYRAASASRQDQSRVI